MSTCRVISCVVGKECLLWPVCSFDKILLAFALLHFVLQSKLACYSGYLLTSYFCIPVPDNEKDFFFLFLFLVFLIWEEEWDHKLLRVYKQTPSSNNTRDDSTHEHHQMVNTEIRLIIFFTDKDGEVLYSQQKQDRELTVAQIMNSLLPNSDLNWRKWGEPLDYSGMT